MTFRSILSCTLLSLLLPAVAPAETVVRVLHIQPSPRIRAAWQEAGRQYESSHPGVRIQFDYLENEAFKAKLPTLLQSRDRPSVFYSWGGGVMYEQINAGLCQDITRAVTASGVRETFYPAALQNFVVSGKVYGLPNDSGPIVLWYNRELCRQAGVDPAGIRSWSGFVDAVRRCRAAGITPVAAGGKDKWPLHFYTTLLMMRLLGKDGMDAAYRDENGGFACPEVVRAFRLFHDFAALQPFQKGYLANTYGEAAGVFHDGRAAFHLMGTWDLVEGRLNAADKKGLPDEKLGWILFPEVEGGKGKASDLMASLNGWLVTRDAPAQTVDFLKFWLGKGPQTPLAAEGLLIPAVKGTVDAIQNPLLKGVVEELGRSGWIQIAMDQLLGPDTGRVMNDVTADLSSGGTTPEKAAQVLEASWQQNKQ